MKKLYRRQAVMKVVLDVELMRAIIPHSAEILPVLIMTLDEATDEMIEEDKLPNKVMESMMSMGSFLERAAMAMWQEKLRRKNEKLSQESAGESDG